MVVLSPKHTMLHAVSGAGVRIWELIDGTRTREQILECITEEYDVDRSQAEADLDDFLGALREAELLVFSDEPAEEEC